MIFAFIHFIGAGESGKSTILKQMRMIHSKGFSDEERQAYKRIVTSNLVFSMKTMLEAMETLDIPLANPSNESYRDMVLNSEVQIESDELPDDLVTAIKHLWYDRGIQEAFFRSSEYQLNDSTKYFMDSIDRIAASGYIPNDQDILRSRTKTTGIIETTFQIGELTYRMFDVGGQRSERKKWIHCFENVTAIVFLVAISEYDQVLVEDETVNRMQEALTLFDSICNSRWFTKTSIILFLNKIDIFKNKVMRVPIERYFPDYQGGPSFESGAEYFRSRFVSLNNSPYKEIYAHLTCGTDTNNVKHVMDSVNQIIINDALRRADLL